MSLYICVAKKKQISLAKSEVCVFVCRVRCLRAVYGGAHQRAVWGGAPGGGQGAGAASHHGRAPEDHAWPASACQHQVPEVEVLTGEATTET